MPEQNLGLKWVSKDADKAKADADKVAAAVQGVNKAQDEGTGAASKLTTEQDKLNASAGDWAGILATISPRLGQIVSVGEQAVKVLGDLGAKQISLTGLFRGGTAALKNYAGAIKLAFAGGAFLLALNQIIAAWRTLKGETQAAVEAQQRDNQASIEAVRIQGDLQKSIAKTADARRQAAALTQEQLTQAAQLANRVAKASGESLATAGDIVGEFGGVGLDPGQLAGLATLRGQGVLDAPGRGEGEIARRTRARRALGARGAGQRISAGQQRVRDRNRQLARQAQGGNIGAAVNLGETVGITPGAVEEAVQRFGLNPELTDTPFSNIRDVVAGTAGGGVSVLDPQTGESVRLSRAMLNSLQNIERAIRQQARAPRVNVGVVRLQDRGSQGRATRDRAQQLSGN